MPTASGFGAEHLLPNRMRQQAGGIWDLLRLQPGSRLLGRTLRLRTAVSGVCKARAVVLGVDQAEALLALPRLLNPSKLFGELVDLVGIEPTTSSMPWKRAPSCATGPLSIGGNPVN